MAGERSLAAAARVLCVGIGGGGDVVGALAVGALAESLGTPFELAGLTWERRPIDPLPGPRRIDELRHAEPLHRFAALAGPRTTGPHGAFFAESRVAEALGRPVALLDPGGGPRAAAEAIAAVAERLGCDLVVLLDVGGDVLAHGDEPGLASPLADAVLLAAAPCLAASGPSVLGAVLGAGCDGELTPAQVAARHDEVAASGGGRGRSTLPPAVIEQVAAVLPRVPTEASAMAIRCARGETGRLTIRDGRRTVELTELGGLLLWFDPASALAGPARLAAALDVAADLTAAQQALSALGVRTELDLEREAAAGERMP